MDLEDIQKSPSEMTDQELLDQILQVRKMRGVIRSEEATKTKGQKPAGEKKQKEKVVKQKAAIAAMSKEQALAMLKQLGLA
jgi:hypothetical protein